MKIITNNPVFIDDVNASYSEYYSNFPDDLKSKPNSFGQSSTGNAFGTTNTSLGNFHIDMPTSNIALPTTTQPTTTQPTSTSFNFKPKENKKYFNLEKTQAEKDFSTNQKLFSKTDSKVKQKLNVKDWFDKKTKLQKGLIITSGAIVLSLATFLVYKIATKK